MDDRERREKNGPWKSQGEEKEKGIIARKSKVGGKMRADGRIGRGGE
jgi:hypothetical protein